MPKKLFLFICAIAFLSCEDITNVYEETNGSIQGKVVISPDYPGTISSLEGVFIQIPGSSVAASTDDEGRFRLFNIPPGTYKITADHGYYYNIYGEIEDVMVSSGETTTSPDIALDYINSYNNGIYITDLNIIDSLGYNHYFSQNGTIINYKSNHIKGRIIKRDANSQNEQGLDTTLSIKINNTRYTVNSNEKGVFSFNFNLSQTSTEMSVWIGDTNQPPQEDYQFYSTNVYYLPTNIRFNIDLNWSSYSTGGGGDAGDFDIHLISHQENDSCWFNNTRPDWGIKEFEYDNPRLYDYTNNYGYSSGSEDLDIDYASQSTYTIKIYYFSNQSDINKTIKPDVRVYLNNNYTYYTSPTDMSVGDVWTIANITIPTAKVKLINQIEKNSANIMIGKK